ncbi:unnamed protein product [Miscanthus lutarioriparius]|uniref:RBR-type E3 ubiquitin transferase n=1 Tax=Miscanthus lutarioriparius TaxID=422564 RepID=A0A811QGY4_9POAL|nr:unnamed protein product [Miscanthus lutarioriparius]
MASGGGGGVVVCNKRYRRSDGDEGETSGRNKRCGVGPSSGANADGESGAYMDDGAKTADDDAAAGEDYMYGYDDFYDDDEEADEQSEGDAAASARDTEQRYVVLTESDLRARQEADAAKVAEVLSIPAGFAAILLRHFKWRVGRVQEEWFTDERRVRGAVGLPAPEDGGGGEVILVPCARSSLAQVCGICFDPYPAWRTRSAGCGHYYCDGCWGGYVAAAVADGARCLSLRCPDPSCSAPVVRELVDAVAAGAKDRARYARFWLRSYVEESGGRIKWCGGAGCTRSVEFLGDAAGYAAATDVFCDSGCRHGFCWGCGEEAHRPVSCGTVRAWLAKNASDSETAKWVVAHTKRCPKCARPIEKNHGCNHMTCGAPCRHQFCWLCFDPWDNHRGCTRYDSRRQRQEVEAAAAAAADEEKEARRRHAKASLDRYLYHYERWAGNGKSLQKALADADELERSELERMARMVDVPAMELGFVTEAYRQIADGRRVLRWAHAYAYFLFLDPERDAAKRDLFDDLQSQANRWLECLHSCAELERKELFGGGADGGDGESTTVAVEAFRAYKEKVANLTGVTRKFMGNLVKAFKTNLPEVVVTPAFDFDHIVNGPTMGSQTAGVGGTISSVTRILNWYTEAHTANGSVQEHSPIRNPVQHPVRPGGHGGLLSNPSQFPPMNSSFLGEATTSMGPPNIGPITPLQVHMSNIVSSGTTSTPSVTFSMSGSGQPIGTELMMVQSTALGSFGSNTSTAWDNSDIAESSSQPNSMGMNRQSGINPLSSAMNVPFGLHQNAQQPPPKYVKIWESWSGTVSKTVAADWPETMQIVRLIAQEHMNNKQYVGKADVLIFQTLNQHGFLGQLQEKKLCAVIQLPSQTLLLSMSDKAGRMIGMLFPKNMVMFKPEVLTQPSPVQQEKLQQQQELLHHQQQQLHLQQQQQNLQRLRQQILQQQQMQQMQHQQQYMRQQKLRQQQLQHQEPLLLFTPEEQRQLLQQIQQQQPRYQQQLQQQMQHQQQPRQQIQHQKNQQQHMQQMQPQQQPLPQMVGTELGSDDDAREDWVTGAGQHA